MDEHICRFNIDAGREAHFLLMARMTFHRPSVGFALMHVDRIASMFVLA
jgi:hypothetical protein